MLFASRNDTIAALATPPGVGGIAVIRISGSQALPILNRIFFARETVSPRVMRYGAIRHGGQTIDHGLAVYFPSPRSYTGEDVAELHCHGGPVPVRETLAALVALGARPAQPGEFTFRAFVNKRISITQAEATMELIAAHTSRAAQNALGQMSGVLGEAYAYRQRQTETALSMLEATLDSPEEDWAQHDLKQAQAVCLEILDGLNTLIAGGATGRLLREGARCVLAGRPNVGKSSLLNALLGLPRAIVTDIPGTTRDTLEELLDVDGIPVVLMDTAGLRESGDTVERIGVARTQDALRSADVILFVLEGLPVTPEDEALFAALPPDVPRLLVINKADLHGLPDAPSLPDGFAGHPTVVVSALTGTGMPNLLARLRGLVVTVPPEGQIVTRQRQLDALIRAREALSRAVAACTETLADCAAMELRDAWLILGELTGETRDEQIIERIFAEFCIGK